MQFRCLLCIVVGPRIQESLDELMKGIASCLDKNNKLPLFVSDGNNQYKVALFNLYNETVRLLKLEKGEDLKNHTRYREWIKDMDK